jgi:Fe-S-cluster containining protein
VVVGAAEIEHLKVTHHMLFNLRVSAKNSKHAMKGTEGKHKRCVALNGIVGQCVACTIYDNRPSACRLFKASWESGVINPKCDLAREAYGLFAFSIF